MKCIVDALYFQYNVYISKFPKSEIGNHLGNHYYLVEPFSFEDNPNEK